MHGWILDLYPGSPGEMVVWLKLEDGRAARLVDHWSPSIFIAADKTSDLDVPLKIVGSDLAWTRSAQKYERVTDKSKSEVVEAKLKDAKKTQQVAGRIERLGPFGAFRLYNADVPPAQTYLYEHDLFPLARCEVTQSSDNLEWDLRDDVWAYDYAVPSLRKVELDVGIAKEGKIARFTDKITTVTLETNGDQKTIDGGSEADKILGLVQAIKELDPDFVLTKDGDTFLFPYLVRRAEANGIAERLVLDRDGTVMKIPSKSGTSYFSYGRIHYKPSAMKLYGRLHIDINTSFAYSEAGFEGLFELSRICRMPMQTSSRASIGKALSSLQFYHASKIDLLVPWKPTLVEHFKDRNELLMADRGGFIFEPKMGVHEGVAEFDFNALYPNIMLRKNISAETVKCSCCPDSKNRIPELGWNTCEKRPGIVPRAIEIVVKKRLGYKQLKNNAKGAPDYDKYNERQAVLKWIGVTCLPGSSYVSIRHNGVEKCIKIGDFVDELVRNQVGIIECPAGVFVAGIDSNLRTKYCKVRQLIKQRNEQRLLRIRMEEGRELETTPGHPFFTLTGSDFVVKTASQLKPGELIPVAKRTPSLPPGKRTLDLIKCVEGVLNQKEKLLWKVSGEPVKAAVLKHRTQLIQAAVEEGYTYQAAVAWTRSGVIPFKFLPLLEIESSEHEELQIGTGRRMGGKVAWIPATINIDESLGFFLGLYVADGSAGRNFVRLDIGEREPDLLENAEQIVADLFRVQPHVYKEKKARMFVLQTNSATVVHVLERVFGLPGSAERGKLKVPEIVFNSSEELAQGFIEGMIAGDGFASKTHQFVNVATASDNLLDQLAFLASRLGLTFRIGSLQGSVRTINFVGPETLSRIGSWRLLKKAHRELVASYTVDCPRNCSHPPYARIPTTESGLYVLTKATRTSSRPHVKQASSMCPIIANRKIATAKSLRLNQQQALLANRVGSLANSDLGFVRIKEILETDSKPEFVYCFELEEDEVPSFFTGRGVTLIHNCFGYLGFNNAKFGRIDAHIAVCAWDRKILTDSARVAERRGFEVIHGIVDSLWIKKPRADREDYLELKSEIEAETGFSMSFEGVYKWVTFLPSKVDAGIPVLNRYFGVYQDGEVKVRGVEARRHDTPLAFARCQMQILRTLAKADSVAEARMKIPECVGIFLRQAEALARHETPASELAFTTNLSKAPEEYTTMTVQHAALNQLLAEGVQLHAGEGIKYVITDYKGKDSKRATPVDVIRDESRYDSERYIQLLAETCSSVLEPFDPRCTAEGLLSRYEGQRNAPLS